MQLQRIEIVKSPKSENRMRLVGEVIYAQSTIPMERIWFEVSTDHTDALSRTGNPWLTCLLPLAVTLGEPLRIDLPVDRVLLDNVHELMNVWKGWYPHLHVIPIEANVKAARKFEKPCRKASFFSLGVDSYFSVLRYDEDAASHSVALIDDLIFIGGFDRNLEKPGTFEQLQRTAYQVASELHKQLVVIATNMRYTRFKETDYSYLSQASILGSALHALEGLEYTEVLLPSSYSYQDLAPYGSHPQTDPLFSTDRTKIIHHGTEFNRVEKTQLIVQSEIALQTLRPCWRPLPSGENCGVCGKCLRTMATLEVLGALDKCNAFKDAELDLEALSTVPLSKRSSIFFREIKLFAEQAGRKDIAKAVERSLKIAEQIEITFGPFIWARKQAERLRGKPIIWKWILVPLIRFSKRLVFYAAYAKIQNKQL